MLSKKQLHITDIKQLERITLAGKILAHLGDVTTRAIERAADPDDDNFIGIKRINKGRYEAYRSLVAMFRDRSRQIDDAKKSNSNARELNYKLDAQKKQIELHELEGDLIRTDETASFLEKLITVVRTKLPTSRKTLTSRLLIAKDDKAVLKILEQRDNELLNEFSNTIENIIRGLAQSTDQDYTDARSVKTKGRRTSE